MPEITGAEAQDFMRLVATRGFSDHIFGFFWNYLEIFDLDGHNFGTVLFRLIS